MEHARIVLKEGRERSLFYRHPWVFSGGIDQKRSDLSVADGSLADIVDFKGNFLARGYYNSKTNIAARVMTFEDETIDAAFFEKRLRQAWNWRKPYFVDSETNAFRLVYAEGDMLPGWIVDSYDGGLVLQIYTAGAENLKTMFTEALVKFFKPKFIYEKSNGQSRQEEGLDLENKKMLFGELGEQAIVRIKENGVLFDVDIVKGQKTGFFLDQRENRLASMPYFKGKKVLNLFSYTGGFSCYAAKAGALEVTSVDVSKEAMVLCESNMKLNGGAGNGFEDGVRKGVENGAGNGAGDALGNGFGNRLGNGGAGGMKHEAVVADVFEFLERAKARGLKYDTVVVDPPAFVKSKKDLNAALKAYARVNEFALNVLVEGGVLITSSCSGHVTNEMFKQAIFQAALRTGDDLVILKSLGLPVDHPNRIYFPEGSYLKFLVLKKKA
jgi:23S rRNA (cytosine1962-C5)-methyltransferase